MFDLIHPVSMTSQQIADLVGARHDSVKRTIERLSERSVISLPPLEEVKIQRERREETVATYRFAGEQGKRDSIVVVAQLSPEFTARLVDRWQELEKGAAKAISPMEQLAIAVNAVMANHEQRLKALEGKFETRHMTVVAYATARGIRLDNKKSAELGRRAVAVSHLRGEAIMPVPDDRWGTVNSYSATVLAEVFSNAL